MTNEALFTNVVRAESSKLTDRGIEDFKKKLDEQVPKWQENYEVPGVAIGIVHEGRIAYTLNYGYVDKKTKKALSDDTVFQAGS
ncbi:penicillin-binding protein, partial [Bacillus cereus]